MSCLYCGDRLLTKTSAGLSCCGCGRPVEQAHPQQKAALSLKSLVAFSLAVLAVGPFLVAISATDQLRAGSMAVDAGSEPESSEP